MGLKAILLGSAVLFAGVPAWADVEAGQTAYDRGDFTAAHGEFQAAAKGGNARAQHSLATLYYDGEGVTKDVTEAVKWYRLSAEQGYLAAQRDLAYAYALGEGVVEDEAEAIKWYRLAAEQGDADSQLSLGSLLLEKNHDQALEWYLRAANQGDVQAQYTLAGIYYMGAGVERDIPEAHFWMSLVAQSPEAMKDGGDNKLRRMRDMISKRMTDEQLRKVWPRIRAWKKTPE